MVLIFVALISSEDADSLENALKREPGSGAMQFTKVCIPHRNLNSGWLFWYIIMKVETGDAVWVVNFSCLVNILQTAFIESVTVNMG